MGRHVRIERYVEERGGRRRVLFGSVEEEGENRRADSTSDAIYMGRSAKGKKRTVSLQSTTLLSIDNLIPNIQFNKPATTTTSTSSSSGNKVVAAVAASKKQKIRGGQPRKEGESLLGGVDYVDLMMSGRRKARLAASKGEGGSS